jgi:hypothetical protein
MLIRFDPFRELDRLTEQLASTATRARGQPHSLVGSRSLFLSRGASYQRVGRS